MQIQEHADGPDEAHIAEPADQPPRNVSAGHTEALAALARRCALTARVAEALASSETARSLNLASELTDLAIAAEGSATRIMESVLDSSLTDDTIALLLDESQPSKLNVAGSTPVARS